jgi:DnaK suppressor protein
MSEIAEIKVALEAKLKELNERATDIDHELSEEPDQDWSDDATESEADEVLEQVGDMAQKEIGQIKRALSKIKAGTYDTCDSCEGKIATKRLAALPYATRCIRCAESNSALDEGYVSG